MFSSAPHLLPLMTVYLFLLTLNTTEENYDYHMLCGSGNCHCFHCWRNAGINHNHSHTQRHTAADTQQSKDTTDLHFQFPVFINSIYYKVHYIVRHILHAAYRARGVFA